MQMFVSLHVKIERSHLKKKSDVKYEFWPFYIIPNINMRVLSASLFVLLNECTLAGCSVHTLMFCLSRWTPSWLRAPEACRRLATLQWPRLVIFSCQMTGLAL